MASLASEFCVEIEDGWRRANAQVRPILVAIVVGALVVCGGVGAGVVATRTAKVVPASLSAPAMCDPRTAGDGCTSLCGIQADLKTGRPGSRGRYDVDRPWARQICGDPFISHRPQV